jgi:hypothetical protein
MDEGLKQRVGDRYAWAARSVLGEAEDGGSCCGGGLLRGCGVWGAGGARGRYGPWELLRG